MKRFLILTGCLALLLSACGGNVSPTPAPTPPSAPTAAPTLEVHQQPVVFPTGAYDKPYPDLGTRFTLTAAQQTLFDTYSKDFNFDISVFKGVSPIDVAQVYIECSLEGLWEGEYNLYYFESKKVTKAQYKTESEQDISQNDIRTRRDYANIAFSNLKEGKFVDQGNGSGYIGFDAAETTRDLSAIVKVKMKMNMKQVNDIWMVNQNKVFESEKTADATEAAAAAN